MLTAGKCIRLVYIMHFLGHPISRKKNKFTVHKKTGGKSLYTRKYMHVFFIMIVTCIRSRIYNINRQLSNKLKSANFFKYAKTLLMNKLLIIIIRNRLLLFFLNVYLSDVIDIDAIYKEMMLMTYYVY